MEIPPHIRTKIKEVSLAFRIPYEAHEQQILKEAKEFAVRNNISIWAAAEMTLDAQWRAISSLHLTTGLRELMRQNDSFPTRPDFGPPVQKPLIVKKPNPSIEEIRRVNKLRNDRLRQAELRKKKPKVDLKPVEYYKLLSKEDCYGAMKLCVMQALETQTSIGAVRRHFLSTGLITRMQWEQCLLEVRNDPKAKLRYVCPSCGSNTDGSRHTTPNGDNCLTVLGRRDWRKLGDYDG